MDESRTPETCPICQSYNVELVDTEDCTGGDYRNRMTCGDCGTFYWDWFDGNGEYVDWELI